MHAGTLDFSTFQEFSKLAYCKIVYAQIFVERLTNHKGNITA